MQRFLSSIFPTVFYGLICFLIVGCSSRSDPERYWGEDERLAILEIFLHIDDYYLYEPDLANLAQRGLTQALSIDETVNTSYKDNILSLNEGSETLHQITFSNLDEKRPELWARASFLLLQKAQRHSDKIFDQSHDALLSKFIKGLVKGLDKYSRYANPQEALSIRENRDGFGGVGITVMLKHNTPDDTALEQSYFVIDYIEPDSPAAEADLETNDILLEIDNIQLEGLGKNEVDTLLRGPLHRKVGLTIRRNEETFNVILSRSQITPNTVFYEANLTYPVIRLTQFNNRTSKRFAESIAQAHNYGGTNLKGIILDLRGNTGGLLNEAIDVADLLLEEGIISQTEGRNPLSYQQFNAEIGNILGDTKLVILIDGLTASAAEILAASLQDQQRAVLVGSTSYGKGTVQNVLPLHNQGELQLTWARYLAPVGYHIEEFGLLPNICTQGQENGIAAVLKTLRATPQSSRSLYQSLKRLQIKPPTKKRVDSYRSACIWEGNSSPRTHDLEMEAARTLLADDSLYDDAIALGTDFLQTSHAYPLNHATTN